MGDDDWKKKNRRKKDHDHNDSDRKTKTTLIDRLFTLGEGPLATTLLKLIAAGIICGTTIALTGILAFASAPVSAVLTVASLGMLTAGATWIFGGLKKQVSLENLNHQKEIAALKSRLAELDERLGHVEIIERFEDRRSRPEIDSPAETTYSSSALNER